MHELQITRELLQKALDAAQRAGAQRITAIDLVIGALSGITGDSVQFHFDMLSRGTLAEGAQVRWQYAAATALCTDCGQRGSVRELLTLQCPGCGQGILQIVGGRACYVDTLELET
jgi:hydrogenase nickel incorporation protein HypA/HybF